MHNLGSSSSSSLNDCTAHNVHHRSRNAHTLCTFFKCVCDMGTGHRAQGERCRAWNLSPDVAWLSVEPEAERSLRR